ncbi:MAG: pSer/pThr/pTyr-binding forkhead associated (FHA) protein [Myxococcota bacterium]|jgi:pSer/pThr/pTyr-binding forkhead associated (FHA) protein
MDRVPLLVATKGPLKGKRYSVTEAGLMVGRDETCDVTIPDAGVSRQHARVLLHNAAVWVQDEGSRNGVFVNGKRVVRHRQLSPGVEMLIGEHAFTLELAPGRAGGHTGYDAGLEPTAVLRNPSPAMPTRALAVAGVFALVATALWFILG